MFTFKTLRTHFAIMLSLALIMTACSEHATSAKTAKDESQTSSTFNVSALEGTWVLYEEGKTTTEIWQANGENKWKATSQTIDGSGQIVFSENVLLEKRNAVMNYCVTTANQNDAQEVCFSLVSSDEKKMRFENKAHDFPQAITYEWVDNNKLLAYIEGPDQHGDTIRIDFEFKREDKK